MLIESLVKRQGKGLLYSCLRPRGSPFGRSKLRQYLPQLFGEFSNLAIYNHTDSVRGGEFQIASPDQRAR